MLSLSLVIFKVLKEKQKLQTANLDLNIDTTLSINSIYLIIMENYTQQLQNVLNVFRSSQSRDQIEASCILGRFFTI